jgi:hypothetical protein
MYGHLVAGFDIKKHKCLPLPSLIKTINRNPFSCGFQS